MVWALHCDSAPDPLAKIVLMGLANHADAAGCAAYPSRETLAQYAGCSVRSVQRKLNDLIAVGLITEGDQCWVQHLRADRRPVVYDLMTGGLFAAPLGPRGDRLSPRNGVTPVSRRDRNGVTGSVERGDTAVTQTVLEPNTPLPPVSGCSRHGTHDERCRACRSVQDSLTKTEARRRDAEDRAARQRIVQSEIDRCGMCNEYGYLNNGRLCDHDPGGYSRAKRGAALAREALGVRLSTVQGKDADKDMR